MGKKAEEMKELMGRLSKFGPQEKSSLSQVEVRKPLPPENLIGAMQDRIHTEKIVRKRIVFRKHE